MDYCKIECTQSEKIKLISPVMEFPPLLKEFLAKETGKSDLKLKVYLKKGHNKNHRLAREGEKSDVEIPMNIGKPTSASTTLYEGLNL